MNNLYTDTLELSPSHSSHTGLFFFFLLEEPRYLPNVTGHEPTLAPPWGSLVNHSKDKGAHFPPHNI